jgi:8-oxo-dGTP diphosphatase
MDKQHTVDFRQARWAPVVHCIVSCNDRALLVRRSSRLSRYPGLWSGISGYLDDCRSLEEKVLDELREEVGITPGSVLSVRKGEIYHLESPDIGKSWLVYPVAVKVRPLTVKLNWEADEFRWVQHSQILSLPHIPAFELVIKALGI